MRRYPDLIIHRIIRNFLINKKTNELTEFKNNLPTFGDLNTKAEQKAVQIERNVNDLKFAEYLKFQVGKTFKTQIVSILNFGFFVEFEFIFQVWFIKQHLLMELMKLMKHLHN
ncbi:hypothetical protein NW072_04250 [Mycoplasmopsis felis]|uniref:hypothetical protein n=1 Tax=Mycoplasmopsis felis TaxID=33923 RepID=UPI0021AEF36C|nr:hypothetical protein [Mycoplasmopsis felis]UWV80197.1 hypothetical protein NW072_04250 [Mycoplasmopsis felis]